MAFQKYRGIFIDPNLSDFKQQAKQKLQCCLLCCHRYFDCREMKIIGVVVTVCCLASFISLKIGLESRALGEWLEGVLII